MNLSESANVTDLRAARKAVSEFREAIEVAEARVRGLKVKLARFGEKLIEAGYAAGSADSEFCQEVFVEFRSNVFLPAVLEFREAIEQGMALMNALERREVMTRLGAIQITDIGGECRNLLADLKSVSLLSQGGSMGYQQIPHESWQASPEKQILFKTYQSLREPVSRIKDAAMRALEARPIPFEAPRTVITTEGPRALITTFVD